MRRWIGRFVALLVVLVGQQPVQADISFFTDRASFLNAAPASMITEGFNVPFGGTAAEVWFPIGGPEIFQLAENSVSKHVVSTFNVPSPGLFISEGAGAVRFSVNPSRFDFLFNASINALGVDITDIDPDFEITFTDDLGNTYDLSALSANNHSPYHQFFGVVNTDPFNLVTFDVTRNSNGYNSHTGKGFLGFDHIQFGLTRPLISPEPSTIATWLLLLGGISWWRLRSRRS